MHNTKAYLYPVGIVDSLDWLNIKQILNGIGVYLFAFYLNDL